MRTTLKRGLGRGAAPNGNGKAVFPPGSTSPVTVLPAAGALAPLAHRADRADRHVARDRVPRRRDRDRWRRVPLLPRVGRRGRGEDARGPQGGAPARRRAPGPARGRARHRLRRAQGRGHQRPLRHAHARARRPIDRLDLAALVPTRHARRDPLPGPDAVHGQDQRGVRDLRPAGLAPDRESPDGRPDQLPHHGELPRLPADRRPPRRCVDRRRPALLQRPRWAVRLRDGSTSSPATSSSTDARRSTTFATGTPTPTSTASRGSSSS